MFIKRLCRLWSTPSPPLLRTILRCGRPPPPPTATNVKVCCGVSLDKACAALSAVSNVTTNARICWMPTVCRVSSDVLKLNALVQHPCTYEQKPALLNICIHFLLRFTHTSPPKQPLTYLSSPYVFFCSIDNPLFFSSVHSHILLPPPFLFISWVWFSHVPPSLLSNFYSEPLAFLRLCNSAPQGWVGELYSSHSDFGVNFCNAWVTCLLLQRVLSDTFDKNISWCFAIRLYLFTQFPPWYWEVWALTKKGQTSTLISWYLGFKEIYCRETISCWACCPYFSEYILHYLLFSLHPSLHPSVL